MSGVKAEVSEVVELEIPVVVEEVAPVVVEEVAPVVVVDVESTSMSLLASFVEGLNEGMMLFGMVFPFLIVMFLGWIGTIVWIPFAIRIVKKQVAHFRSDASNSPESENTGILKKDNVDEE